MKFQWSLLFGIVFALIVAIFAVINVEPVTVNYLFGTAQWPLILVILGSVFMGGVIVGSVGIVRIFVLQREVKNLQKQKIHLEKEFGEIEKSDSSSKKKEEASHYKKTAPDSVE